MKNYSYWKYLKVITLLALILLLFGGTSYSQTGWVAQSLPVSGQIDDMAFLNKDTGFIAMGSINTLMRTLNGGTNWDIIRDFRIYQLEKIDTRTLYAINYDGNKMYRTYDGGTSWDSITAGGWCGISFINKDTGWASSWSGIYKTINAGLSYSFLSNAVNCGKIVFLKENYSGDYCGFIIPSSSGALFKTSNGGLNWVNVPNPIGSGEYNSIFFLNKDTGWSYYNYNIRPNEFIYTSNGGSSWNTQYIDSQRYYSAKIYFANSNIGWGSRGNYKLYATSTGGSSWGFQTIPISSSNLNLFFIDSLLGWTTGNISTNSIIAKTTNGGGIITYIGIDSNNSTIPIEYKLNQNYPNPFNPSTIISFSLLKENYVTLKIYDLMGKEILMLYDNKFLQSGNYKASIDFNYINVPSGVYFYTLTVYGRSNSSIFKETKKMLYLK